LHAPSIEVLNEVNRYWLRLCKNPGEETNFSLANSIWVADDIELKNRFREDMQKDYAATVHSLASDPLQSQKEINLWAKENTNGMITEFLKEPLKRTVKLALYNASYFEGMWRCQFWIQKGYLSPFKTPSGELKLEMMHNNYSDNYYESSKYKGIDIDYYGKIFCMRVIVPNDDCTLDEVMNSLAKGIVKPEKRAILLSMPKFKIRHRIENLEGLLKASGLGIIFNDPACFSSITSHSGLLKEAKLSQEAVIECDENGTKVAAVTGFAMAWDSGKRIEYTKLVIDRPFIFSIVEKKSGAVMFAGIVSDPTK
ncbi:MAG: hypothetical protein K2G23_05455, partial [Muribaculaceae bacterium]|nr:hypothetical protein [Muribaculaceae bacterium]